MPSRLGDDVDDFCIKCKRITNHVVVSLLSDEPAKVRCRTCHSDHDYRHEVAPPPKVDSRKAALFKQVLGNATGKAPDAALGDTEALEGVAGADAGKADVTQPDSSGEKIATPEIAVAEIAVAEIAVGTAANQSVAPVEAAPAAAPKAKARKKAQGQ